MATGDRNNKGKPTDIVVHFSIDGKTVLCGRKHLVKTNGTRAQGETTCLKCKAKIESNTEEIAKQIANHMHMPYCWQDIKDRLISNRPLPEAIEAFKILSNTEMEIKVSKCIDCPFFISNIRDTRYGYCDRVEEKIPIDITKPIPFHCPLKEGEIVVKLK